MVYSSLHAQNEALAEFLSEEPDLPSPLYHNISSFMSSCQMKHASLVRAAEMASGKKGDKLEDHLIQCTLAITDMHMCSVPKSSPFLLRTFSILWRQLICGPGEPDLTWANPASMPPLRLHSFASILHLLGGACLYFSKNGVKQLDGVKKLDVVTLGRVMALLFDERNLFGNQAFEEIDEELWTGILRGNESKPVKRKSPKKGRHVRTTLDLFNKIQDVQPREDMGDRGMVISAAGELASPVAPKKHTVLEKLLGGEQHKIDNLFPVQSLEQKGQSDESKSDSAQPSFKIDTKSDFQSALRAAAAIADDDFERVQSDGEGAAIAMVQAFGSVSSSNSRGWLTAPNTRALSTIQESDDGDESDAIFEGNESLSAALVVEIGPQSPADKNTSQEGLVRKKEGVRQFRIPHLEKGKIEEGRPLTIPSVPKSDEEIETAGLPFLDVIGKSLGVE